MKIELIWSRSPGSTGAQEQWYCTTIYAAHAGVPTQAMADADYAAIRAWATANWRARATPQITLREIKAYGLHTVPPTKFTIDQVYPDTVIQGTQAASSIAWQLAPVISLRTGAIGQRPKPPHGRIYHVAPTANDIDVDGQLLLAVANNYDAAYEALRTSLNGVGNVGTWSIVSYWLGGTRAAPVLRPAPLVLPVSHVYVPRSLGALRSRRARQQSYTFN